MPKSSTSQRFPGARGARSSGLLVGTIAALAVLAASFAALALATSPPATVSGAPNAALGERVLVSQRGRTLYVLTPETSRHLLCKSSACLATWPPLTVPSSSTKLKAGGGVHGRLGLLRRSNGLVQVTLGGLPLYRFAGDHANGEANGQGLRSFGGTWHAVLATGAVSSKLGPAAASTRSVVPVATQPTTATTPAW